MNPSPGRRAFAGVNKTVPNGACQFRVRSLREPSLFFPDGITDANLDVLFSTDSICLRRGRRICAMKGANLAKTRPHPRASPSHDTSESRACSTSSASNANRTARLSRHHGLASTQRKASAGLTATRDPHRIRHRPGPHASNRVAARASTFPSTLSTWPQLASSVALSSAVTSTPHAEICCLDQFTPNLAAISSTSKNIGRRPRPRRNPCASADEPHLPQPRRDPIATSLFPLSRKGEGTGGEGARAPASITATSAHLAAYATLGAPRAATASRGNSSSGADASFANPRRRALASGRYARFRARPPICLGDSPPTSSSRHANGPNGPVLPFPTCSPRLRGRSAVAASRAPHGA